jgi:FemAB-related protein (PEP-CTERM system-associated)
MNAFAPLGSISIAEVDLGRERRAVEAFLADRPEAEPFHLPAWSLAVEEGCRQRSRYLVARRSDERIVGVLPLTEVRSLLFGSALVSAGFGVGGGIIAEDEEVTDRIADAAMAMAGQLGAASVELRGGCLPPAWRRIEGRHAAFRRELPIHEDAILPAIPRKQRAEVRRSLGLDLTCRIANDDEALDDHYRAYAESVRNLGTPVFSRSLFRAMRDCFGADADVLTVYAGEEPIASVFTFYHKEVAYPYWGGGTFAARHLRANEHLYYQLMRHAVRRGCTSFDFGRSKVGTGAYAYKKNWGFEPRPLVYAEQALDGREGREINPLDPKYRLKIAAWQRLPLWLANAVGPHIARGLG